MYLGGENEVPRTTADEENNEVAVNNRKNKKYQPQVPPKKSQEMGLRQFSTVSELLAKLKLDLTSSFPSFRREFASPSTCDGVTLLLELLRAVQLAQTNITGGLNQLGSRANHVMFRRALVSERAPRVRIEWLRCVAPPSRTIKGKLIYEGYRSERNGSASPKPSRRP